MKLRLTVSVLAAIGIVVVVAWAASGRGTLPSDPADATESFALREGGARGVPGRDTPGRAHSVTSAVNDHQHTPSAYDEPDRRLHGDAGSSRHGEPDRPLHGDAAPPPHETGSVLPWMPRPAVPPPGVIVGGGPWKRGIYESIQVNVDEQGENIPGDAANEPSIAIDPTNPNKIVIGWRQFDTIESDFRQAGWAYSHDAGKTWTFPGVLEPGVFGSDPVLDSDADGNFYYHSIRCGSRECGGVFKSTDGGVSWSDRVPTRMGDKPWMAIDRTDDIGRGNIYATWVGAATRSTDGGSSFEYPRSLPGTPKWGTVAVGPDGEVYVGGGRENVRDGFVLVKSTSARDPEVQLPYPYDGFGGIDFAVPVHLGGHLVFMRGVNGDGLDGQAWVAVDHSVGPSGSNVYMLASVDPGGADPLDVMFARSTNGGVTWTDPIRINDDPPSRDVWQWFGTMAVAPDGRIDVIWNDTRTELRDHSELYYSYSVDTGLTWTRSTPVSPPFNHRLGYPRQAKLGDYYDMISDDGGANVAYAATFNGEQDVYFLRIPAYDCNQNGIDDREEIERGLLEDCTENGLPDICERDCNENGAADSCDIAEGESKDCNTNGIPDECDISFGESDDCTEDGIPDECEPDCNGNDVADTCDIQDGTSEDLNNNGVPDECEPDCDAHPRQCRTWFVDDDAPEGGDGKSWETAFNDLQDALALEGKGHQIWVAEGVYKPAGPNGPRDAAFQLKNGTAIYGGFKGNETKRKQRDPDQYETILSGDLNGDDGPNFENNDENSYHVVTAVDVGPSAILNGLTIMRGNADGHNDANGGGVHIKDASPKLTNVTFHRNSAGGGGAVSIWGGNPVLVDCVVRGNRATWNGGGLAVGEARLVLVGCTFEQNSSDLGGGIELDSSDYFLMENCIFKGNSSGRIGGGAYLSVASDGHGSLINCRFFGNSAKESGGAILGSSLGELMIRQCVFSGNQAGENGGAIAAPSRTAGLVTINNCTFSGNRAGGTGGGLAGKSVSVSNSTFSRNIAADSGGGMSLWGDHRAWRSTVAGCILWGNRAPGRRRGQDQLAASRESVRVSYTCIQRLKRLRLDGSGNIGDDPLFVDPKGPDRIIGTEDDNLRLRPGSPAIDAGVNDFVLPDIYDLDKDGDTEEPTPFDLDGQPRRFDDPKTPDTGWGKAPVVDMGAYEFSGLCESIRRIRVRCNDGGRLIATFKTRLEEGRWLRASITDGPPVQVFIGSRGRGKAKWRDLPGGTYKVCVVECSDKCRAADCD